LLQQLLRLARAEQLSGSRQVGLSTAATESTDLGDVIGERVTFWQPVADKRNQVLRHRTDRPGVSAQVARHEIEQLLDVAVDNALRYAGPDTTVSVSTAPSEEYVDLIISDNGSGLPDEDLSKAVGRFWRRRRRSHRNRTGVGNRRRNHRRPRRDDRGGARPRRRPADQVPPPAGG